MRRHMWGPGTAALAGLVLALLAAVAPAQAASDHVTARPGSHSWRTVDRMVPVRTGPAGDVAIDLDTRLYVPGNADRRTPRPAILMTHGFGLDKTSNEVVTTAKFFAAHGYVVLTYTSSGF